MTLGLPMDWGFVANPAVTPLATDDGGYLFVRMDPLARVFDLHAAFRPSGWGKVAAQALKASLRLLTGWDVVCATEVAGNWRSRPPRSFGFRPAGPMAGGFRTWVLTRERWEASPARARME